MKKKLISMILVTTMLLGLLAGCGKKEEKNNGKVTLNVGLPQNVSVSDYENNALTKYIEESLDMNIEFRFFAGSPGEYSQQLALMCTSGEELPDVLWGFTGLGRKTMNQYGEDGYFVDLTNLIEEHAPNYKAKLETVSKEVRENIISRGTNASNGEFYAMPTYTTSEVADYMQNMMYINQTWLDAVGMQAPTTVDELYDVLVAFKTKDPNKNGEPDEIPMLSSGIWLYVINAFVHFSQSDMYNVTDGKVWSPVVTDEYRQAMIYLNKLTSEGLLSDLSFNATNADIKNLVSGTEGHARVGIWCGHPLSYTSTTTEILDEYVGLKPLEDATGLGGYGVRQPNYQVYGGFITKDCENQEAAMKFLDFFYDDETATRVRHGEKGVDWEEGTGTSSYGTESHIQVINGQAYFEGNSTWGTTGTTWMTPENNLAIAEKGFGRNAECSRLAAESMEIMLNFKRPKEVAVNLIYTEAEETTKEKLESTFGGEVKKAIILFATGEQDPKKDSDWKAYLDTLKKCGDSDLLKVYQSAYTATYK